MAQQQKRSIVAAASHAASSWRHWTLLRGKRARWYRAAKNKFLEQHHLMLPSCSSAPGLSLRRFNVKKTQPPTISQTPSIAWLWLSWERILLCDGLYQRSKTLLCFRKGQIHFTRKNRSNSSIFSWCYNWSGCCDAESPPCHSSLSIIFKISGSGHSGL